MTDTYVYHLAPLAPFHFGERGVGLEEAGDTFRSDALFAALCYVLQEGWGTAALEQILDAFRSGDPPFLLSSCYPYAGDILFFPRPFLQMRFSGPTDDDAGKRLKRVRFVSLALFRRWVEGEDLSAEAEARNFRPESYAWHSTADAPAIESLLGRDGADGALWCRDEVERVAVDRETSASAVYRCGRLVFRKGCGLYFLAVWRHAAIRARIEAALAILGDAGIGGRQSAGYGQFALPAPAQLTLDAPDDPGAALTLSLYWPTPSEIQAGVLGSGAQYELVSRHGWMSSPSARALRRRQVRMVTEGSVVRATDPWIGALADVTPEGFAAHPVYRNGIALTLPIRAPSRRLEAGV